MVVLLFESKLIDLKVFSGGSVGTLSTAMWEIRVQPLGRENPREEEMATHSSIFPWGIPWTKEPGGLQSMGSQSQTGLSKCSNTFTFLRDFRIIVNKQ